MDRRGRFFVFEGIDGSGKSQQARGLADLLRRDGHEVLETFEPTGNLHSREIDELLNSGREGISCQRETLLFTEDRRQHVSECILPALEDGIMVICDRYYYSTMAYQGAAGDEVERIRELNESFAPVPDRVYLLDLSVEEALSRIHRSDRGQVSAFENSAYLARVRDLFLTFEDPCILKVDSSQDADVVADVIQTDVQRVLRGEVA